MKLLQGPALFTLPLLTPSIFYFFLFISLERQGVEGRETQPIHFFPPHIHTSQKWRCCERLGSGSNNPKLKAIMFANKAMESKPDGAVQPEGEWAVFLLCLEFLRGFLTISRNVREVFSLGGRRRTDTFTTAVVCSRPGSSLVGEATEGKENSPFFLQGQMGHILTLQQP